MEFKVKDKVRIVRDTIFNDKYYVGDVCEVKSIDSDGLIELAMADGGVQCVFPRSYGYIEKVEENTMKYKVGDKAIVREWDDMAKEYSVDDDGEIELSNEWCFAEDMKKFCGKTVTITGITREGDDPCYEIDGGNYWHFTDEMLEPAADTTLIIEHYGRTTVAHIGKTYGVARCNPDDKYDAMTGDILAVQRLYAKKTPKKKIMLYNKCIGIVGEPSPFKDVDGKPLRVGDCVDDGTPNYSFIAHDGEYGFYVMGWGSDGESLNKPLRKVDDYDHEYFPNTKVIPCQQ